MLKEMDYRCFNPVLLPDQTLATFTNDLSTVILTLLLVLEILFSCLTAHLINPLSRYQSKIGEEIVTFLPKNVLIATHFILTLTVWIRKSLFIEKSQYRFIKQKNFQIPKTKRVFVIFLKGAFVHQACPLFMVTITSRATFYSLTV